MKKTKLKLDKTTITTLTTGQMLRAVGGATALDCGNTLNPMQCTPTVHQNCLTNYACSFNCGSQQWTCETYGCGTTATIGC